MSLVSIIKQIQAAANTGASVEHLEEELKSILATGQGVAADVSADIKQVEALVAEAKAHKLDAQAALAEVTTIVTGLKNDVHELLEMLPALRELYGKLPEIAKLIPTAAPPAESAK